MTYTPLITILAAGFGLAFVLGYLACRMRISPIIGYLLAGVLIGPSTPGYIADPALASELAEIGVILLMFGVGLHFSLDDLKSVKKIAIPGALVQIVLATALGMTFARSLGWSLSTSIVFGFSLSVASTVVLIRALEDWTLIKTMNGKIAIGWLIVEDLAVILILVFLPPLANITGFNETHTFGWRSFGYDVFTILFTIAKVTSFIVLMLMYGRRLIPRILQGVADTGSSELFRLAVLAIALVVAFIAAKLFGVSFALGSFFAGMILNETKLSQRATEETLPMREAFAVLFFVAMGMLLRPETLFEHPLLVIMTTLIIMMGKSIAAFFIVIAFRYPLYTALTISASLAQSGEFSFILAETSYKLNLLSAEGTDLIIAGAFISIMLNPLLFKLIRWYNHSPNHL